MDGQGLDIFLPEEGRMEIQVNSADYRLFGRYWQPSSINLCHRKGTFPFAVE
jgi:hypothetical protein